MESTNTRRGMKSNGFTDTTPNQQQMIKKQYVVEKSQVIQNYESNRATANISQNLLAKPNVINKP